MHSFAKDPLFAYDETVAAITALTDLVTTAMGTADEQSRIAYGVSVMFDQQIAILNEARDLVRLAVAPKATAQAGIRRVEPAGINMVMVTEPDGRKYMTTPELAGVDRAGVRPMRFDSEPPMEIRKRVIAELVSDGKAAGDIAQAMGLKKDTVEKVIGQLLARQSEPDASQADKAVNA